MDLLSLVAACTLGFDRTAMQALVLAQSNAKPWSFSVAADAPPRVFRSLATAVAAAATAQPAEATVRVGLAGLDVDLRAATAQPNEAMFAPCPNLTLASRRLASLQRACEGKPAFASDPVWCAIAVYRGSWETPDNKFADSVRLAMSKEELPNPIVEDATTTAGTTRDAQGDSDVSAHAGGWESSIFVTPAAGQRRSVLPPESGAAASAAQRDGATPAAETGR